MDTYTTTKTHNKLKNIKQKKIVYLATKDSNR